MTGHSQVAEQYNAQVAAVLEQRTRLRGKPPTGDQMDGIAPDHPIMKADAHSELDSNHAAIAALIDADDVVVDVGGGAGRVSLPMALRCRELVNVEQSSTMCTGFRANARRAGLENTRVVQSPWPMTDPPI